MSYPSEKAENLLTDPAKRANAVPDDFLLDLRRAIKHLDAVVDREVKRRNENSNGDNVKKQS